MIEFWETVSRWVGRMSADLQGRSGVCPISDGELHPQILPTRVSEYTPLETRKKATIELGRTLIVSKWVSSI